MSPNTVTININLGALLGELQQSLQTAINLVAVALSAKAPDAMDELRLPTEGISTGFAASVRWSQADATRFHRTWAISNGFRDAVEGASSFIESAHRILAIWKLAGSDGRAVQRADFQREWDGTAFHRLGLPDKLARLKNVYAVAMNVDLERHLLSINNARNCLVHRRGIVGRRDLNFEGQMVVEWRKLCLILRNDGGERELVFDQRIEQASELCLRFKDDQKRFSLGERIEFTTQEFADVTWGIFAFGSNLVDLVSALDPCRQPRRIDTVGSASPLPSESG
jgi:hypothetical protein